VTTYTKACQQKPAFHIQNGRSSDSVMVDQDIRNLNLLLAITSILGAILHSVTTRPGYVSQLAICIWEERKQRDGGAETNQQKSGSDGSLPLF
jgi:hypothetical protein